MFTSERCLFELQFAPFILRNTRMAKSELPGTRLGLTCFLKSDLRSDSSFLWLFSIRASISPISTFMLSFKRMKRKMSSQDKTTPRIPIGCRPRIPESWDWSNSSSTRNQEMYLFPCHRVKLELEILNSVLGRRQNSLRVGQHFVKFLSLYLKDRTTSSAVHFFSSRENVNSLFQDFK